MYRETDRHTGVTLVLAAAVVNKDFRKLLLTDARTAIDQGYLGESFLLSEKDAELIRSIRAKDLPDFAKQINNVIRP